MVVLFLAKVRYSQEINSKKLQHIKKPKEIERIHEETINEDKIEQLSELDTDEIIESLTESEDKLIITQDGKVMNGNHRIKVLEDRGFDTSKLIDKAEIHEKIDIAPWEN